MWRVCHGSQALTYGTLSAAVLRGTMMALTMWCACHGLQVLTYGILSAAVLRGIMIGLGAELLENFKGVLLVFAGVLLYSSWQLLAVSEDDEEEDLTDNWIVKTCKCACKTALDDCRS